MERAVLLSDGQQLALNLPSVKIYEQILPEVVDRIKGDAPRDRIYELEKLKCNNGVEERTYQIEVWHKDCFDLLNVTVIQRIRLHDGKTGHVVLFSDDLELPHENLTSYGRTFSNALI
jgi:hypothetical protein